MSWSRRYRIVRYLLAHKVDGWLDRLSVEWPGVYRLLPDRVKFWSPRVWDLSWGKHP